MAETVFKTPLGLLRVQGWQAATMAAAGRLGEELARSAARPAGFVELDGMRAYLKGGPLRPRSAWRHGLRRLLLRRKVPRINEYFNMCWLANRHFQTPVPLAAGVLLSRGLPRYQFFASLALEGHEELGPFLRRSAEPARAAVLDELARELGRMHSLRFVHHDLYPRNLLVAPPGTERRVVFLDAWAGGLAPQWRGPAYDLGCLFLHCAELLEHDEQVAFLDRYFAERVAQDLPVRRNALLYVARAERTKLRRQLERDPARLRGAPLPRPDWPASTS